MYNVDRRRKRLMKQICTGKPGSCKIYRNEANMRKSRKPEKEYRKKHFFALDDDFDDEDYEGEDDDETDYDDDEEDYDDDEVDYDEEDDDDDEENDDEDEDDDDEDDDDDDEEDDDDEVDDDEEDYDEDDDGWSSEDEKRARRRARRIRNQILSYVVVAVLIAGVLGGCFLGGSKLIQKFQANRQEKESEEQLTDLEGEEDQAVDLGNSGEEDVQIEEPALSPLDEIAMARIAEMPLTDKVAALFMITPEQLTGVDTVTRAGDTTKEALTKYKVGGLVYTEKNITGGDQLKELLSNTALIDQTLFLAVNEEGGENSTVASKLSVTEVPDMASVSGTDGAHLAGDDTGTYLAEYGFNLNLAPVADVKIAENSILGNRSFGTDAGQVGEMAAAYVRGLTEKGVSACVKTFPGLGAVTESTADGMADTERSQSDMEGAEFLAYQTAINAGSEFVMVGTVSAPQLTGDNTPCCLSSAVIGLLRNNLGYDGIVITGALNEAAVKDYYTSAEAAEKALRAGADMIYMPENFTEAYEGLLQAAEADEALQSRIDEALLRIYRVKYKDKEIGVPADDAGSAESAPEEEASGEDVPAE